MDLSRHLNESRAVYRQHGVLVVIEELQHGRPPPGANEKVRPGSQQRPELALDVGAGAA